MSKKKSSSHRKNNTLENKVAKKVSHDKKQHPVALFFNKFAQRCADLVGNAFSFLAVSLIIVIWACLGPYFNYSDTWQLVINTSSSIVTFLVVFLIQNTQNRDTEIINLKLDELIKSKKGATNKLLNLSELSDVELKDLEKEYMKIKNKKTGS